MAELVIFAAGAFGYYSVSSIYGYLTQPTSSDNDVSASKIKTSVSNTSTKNEEYPPHTSTRNSQIVGNISKMTLMDELTMTLNKKFKKTNDVTDSE